MKPIRLFTSLLAAGTVALASCSVPRLAHENNGTDDVYNSVAQAQEYVQPAPKQSAQYKDTSSYDDDYGTSDPYYDMDYSSRINRFYYGSPFRGYYDPFYYDYYGYNSFSPWYAPGFSMSFGWGWGILTSVITGTALIMAGGFTPLTMPGTLITAVDTLVGIMAVMAAITAVVM